HPDDRAVQAYRQVDGLVAVRSRQHTERNADEGGNEHPSDRELHRRGETHRDLVPHRLAPVQLTDRGTEVAGEDIPQVRKVLNNRALVESQLLTWGFDRGRRRILAAEGENRSAWKDPEDNQHPGQREGENGAGQ